MRGLFFVAGLFAMLQGMVCLGLDSLTLSEAAAETFPNLTGEDRTFRMPIWVGTTLAATGFVTLLYAIALPAKKRS